MLELLWRMAVSVPFGYDQDSSNPIVRIGLAKLQKLL